MYRRGLNPDKPPFCEEDVCHWDLTLFRFQSKQKNRNSPSPSVLLSKALTIFDWSERTEVGKIHTPLTYKGDQLVISLKEARKLLGKKSKNLTNEELETLTQEAETVVRIAVQNYLRSIISEERSRIIKAGIKASKAKKS